MKEYLKTLKRPGNWNDLADLLSKTVVAVMAAVIAAGVWAYEKHEKARAEKEQAVMSANAAKRDNIALFLEALPKDGKDPLWKVKSQSLSQYCVEEFNNGDKSALLKVLCDANQNRTLVLAASIPAQSVQESQKAIQSSNAADYVDTDGAASRVAALAAVEAANTVPSNKKWYAVLASLPLSESEDATKLAHALNRKLVGLIGYCDAHIYETKISKSYAITSGEAKTEEDAKARVRIVRAAGLVADAFAQPDREWKLSTTATQPRSGKGSTCD